MLKKAIIFFLLSLVSLFLGFFLFLKNGIKLDNLSLANVNISQLYIKLDKKLIVTINTLEVLPSKNKDQSSSSDIDPAQIIQADKLLGWIELVQIDKLLVEKQELFIKLVNKTLFVKHKEGEATLSLNIKANDLLANLNAKSYKYGSKLNVDLDAKIDTLSTKLYKPVISMQAMAVHKDIKIDIDAKLKAGILKYKASSNDITNLDFIEDFIKLDEKNKKLLENLSFSKIKIENINGQQSLEYINDFDPKSLNANIKIEDINFKYDKYPLISQKQITANLKDGELDLNLESNKVFKNISLDGRVLSTLDAKVVDSDIDLYYKDIAMDIAVDIKDEVLDYKVSSNRFKSITTFKDFLSFPKAIKTWAVDRLNAKGVKVDSVTGKIYMDDFYVDLSSLRVNARLFDIVMDFNPKKAYPLNADVVALYYDGKDMNFKLTKPRSNDVDLEGSDAVIYDMLGSNNGLLLRLQSISPLNWTLVRVVQSYGVSIPNDLGLRQTKGSSDIKVKIDIPFSARPLDIFVKIDNENSRLKIKEKDIDFKTFHFVYKDKKVFVKNTLAKYEVYNANIKDMVFDIPKSSLDLKLSAFDNNKTFALDLFNKTNLKEKITNGQIDLNFVDLKDVVSIKDEIIPYNATFGDDVDAKLPSLGIEYQKQKDDHFIKIVELKRFEPFIIPMVKAGLEKSSLEVKSHAFKDTDIKLYAKGAMDINKSYEVALESNVNLDKNISNGTLKIYGLKFDDKIDLNNTNIPYSASFGKDIKAKLPSLDIEYKNQNKIHHIDINDIPKLTSLIKMFESYTIPKSDIHLNTKDFKTMNINLNSDISDYGVFYKKEKQENIFLSIDINNMKEIAVVDKNKMIKADITLDDKPIINLITNDFAIEYMDDSNETNTTKKEKIKELQPCKFIVFDLPKIDISMNNGYFKYNKNLLSYENISLDTYKDKVSFELRDKNSSILAKLDKYDVDLALNINSNFVNNIAGLKAIEGGNIDLNASGTQCVIDGNIYLKDVDIKEAAILNKIFVVINSTPAILNPFFIIPNAVRFAGDGFRLSSYLIDEGKMVFNLNRDINILDISKVESISTQNSFYGKAMLDLNQNTIDSTVEVSFMQGMAKVIDFIPVIGYWVLGDDGRFSYSVDIKGKLSEPEINTHVGKETLMAPVNIAKRLITSPAKLVEFATSEENEEKDSNSSK